MPARHARVRKRQRCYSPPSAKVQTANAVMVYVQSRGALRRCLQKAAKSRARLRCARLSTHVRQEQCCCHNQFASAIWRRCGGAVICRHKCARSARAEEVEGASATACAHRAPARGCRRRSAEQAPDRFMQPCSPMPLRRAAVAASPQTRVLRSNAANKRGVTAVVSRVSTPRPPRVARFPEGRDSGRQQERREGRTMARRGGQERMLLVLLAEEARGARCRSRWRCGVPALPLVAGRGLKKSLGMPEGKVSQWPAAAVARRDQQMLFQNRRVR